MLEECNTTNWQNFEWEEHRKRLAAIAALHLQPMLLLRLTADDVVQQTFLNALKRPDFMKNRPDIPCFAKLRILLGQTIKDFERQYLACQKRDIHNEVSFDDNPDMEQTQIQGKWNFLAASVTSPRTRLARADRNDLIRKVLDDLSESDRNILEMRHFEELSNAECAGVLGISPDAASIRYIRALKKMRQLLNTYSEFGI